MTHVIKFKKLNGKVEYLRDKDYNPNIHKATKFSLKEAEEKVKFIKPLTNYGDLFIVNYIEEATNLAKEKEKLIKNILDKYKEFGV